MARRARTSPDENKTVLIVISSEHLSGIVGGVEGALYEAKGYYRPQEDCVMFTRDDVPFCAVCRRAIEKVIDLYTSRQSTVDSRQPKTGTR